MRTKHLAAALGLGLAIGLPAPALAAKAAVHTGLFDNLAVGGYDPVAYFTDGRPVRGNARFRMNWQGAEFRFASAAHLAAFRADPVRYAPRYGGYCAWAVAQGYTAAGDPNVWRIVDGRLYLNYDAEIGRLWARDIPGFIAAGDRNWPRVLGR